MPKNRGSHPKSVEAQLDAITGPKHNRMREKVGEDIWNRYAKSVRNGILTQKEADAAMLVERRKDVTTKNRERKAKRFPNVPKRKRNKSKHH